MRRRFLVPSLVLVTGCALTLTSCAGADQEGSTAHRMSVWVSGTSFGEDIGTLIADNARIPKDVPNGTGAVHAACGTSLNDAEMANTNLPSPDPEVTDLLTKAYGLEGTAANQCYDAGATNKKLLAESDRNAIKAEALYQRGLQRIRVIDGTRARDDDDRGQQRATRARRHLRMSDDRRHRRRARPPPPPGPVGAPHRPLPDRESARRRGQPDDGQPRGAGLHGAQARRRWRSNASRSRARLVAAGGGFTVSLLARTERDVVRRFVKPVIEVERGPDGAVLALSGQPVTEVGPDRLPVLASAAGYLDCRLTERGAPRGATCFCIGEVTGVGGRARRGAAHGGHPHALRRLIRRPCSPNRRPAHLSSSAPAGSAGGRRSMRSVKIPSTSSASASPIMA